jgi:isoleucyl-tRNA synthetase
MSRLGQRFRQAAGKVKERLEATVPNELYHALETNDSIELSFEDEEERFRVTREDVQFENEWPETFAHVEAPNFTVVLETNLTDELIAEGMARDVVRHVQQLRKDADLEMDARIRVRFEADDETVAAAVEAWADYIKAETLALDIVRGLLDEPDRVAKLAGSEIKLAISEA